MTIKHYFEYTVDIAGVGDGINVFAGKVMNLSVLNRHCGECTACCMACGVVELNKAMNTLCPHQTHVGCEIYADRPQTCRDFTCAWLAGDLPEHFRPDRSGIIFWDGGQLPIQASLTQRDIPIDRVQYLAAKLSSTRRRLINGVSLSYRQRPVLIIPADLRLSAKAEEMLDLNYKELKKGLFLAQQKGE